MENFKLSSLEYNDLLALNEKVQAMIDFLNKEIKENTEEIEEN